MNEQLTSIFNPRKYSVGDEIDCKIVKYYALDNREVLSLSDVHLKNDSHLYTLDYVISRTNGDLINKIYNTEEGGANALINKPARLINLKYDTIGYNGQRHENQSWLFQPLDSIIKSGSDWYLI